MEQPIPFKSLNKKYICTVCSNVFINVNQAQCGCRFCSDCLDKLLPNGKCNQCGEIWHDKAKLVDKAFQKELSNLSVSCDKCNWSGLLLNYQIHNNEKHAEKVCEYCQEAFNGQDSFQAHLINFPNGSCRKYMCTYHNIGCDCLLLGKNELQTHLKFNVDKHLWHLFLHLKDVSMIINQNDNRYNASNNDTMGSEGIKRLKNTQKHPFDSTTLVTWQEGYNDRLMNMCFNQEKLCHELEISRNNEKQLREELEELQKRLTVAQVTMIDLEQRLMQQEKTSSNGTLVWKILNVKEKIIESKSGKQTSFYSPIFYSHQNGYKMRCRVYLNGDGMGRGTHVSLFFVIMKGEYDGLLNWPFRQKVTFTLIDQLANESREHITDAFKPDPKSNSFIKPVSDMNIASGIPLFCSLPKLHSTDHEYIKDDIMFIKIIVDTRDLNDI